MLIQYTMLAVMLAQGFEVASIKPSGAAGGRSGLEFPPGGGLRVTGASLKSLIAFAYEVDDSAISGGPKWLDSAGFNIVAKAEQGAPSSLEAVRQRTRVLLADRFHLVVHKASRQSSMYALVVAKGGPRLEAIPGGSDDPPSVKRSRGRIDGARAPIQMLAGLLSNWLGVEVTDRTGLKGIYNFKLEFADDPLAASDISGGSNTVFSALQEQLGLKLESLKGSSETLIVDRAERPAEN